MAKLQKFNHPTGDFVKYPYPFKEGETLLFLGEIDGMPGHGSWVAKSGLTYFGYDVNNFSDLTEDEI